MRLVKAYFSPTGGTKKILDIVADEFDGETIEVDLTDSKGNWKNFKLDPGDLVFIAVPSYGGRVPETALKRLERLDGKQAETILIVSYGNRDYDDTVIELYDKVKESSFNPIAGITAIAEHSLLPQFATDRPDSKDLEELRSFARAIKNREIKGLKGLPGKRPYKKSGNLPLIPKKSKDCNQCKVCYLLCPTDAIDFHTLKADKKKCITCMRCIKVCPENARKLNKVVLNLAGTILKKEASARKSNELFDFSKS